MSEHSILRPAGHLPRKADSRPEQEGTPILVEDDKLSNLSNLLRTLGAVIIIAAASIFLIQNWGHGNDIQRYLMLLAFSGVLSAAGFFCGLRLHESKGARTLLGLAVAVVPIHFAVLGGLLYSQFPWDGLSVILPEFATWVAPSKASALATVGISIALLAPMVYLSLLSLGRTKARELSMVFFGLNLALLLPVRNPDWTALLVALGGLLIAYVELRIFCRETSLQTFEGRFLRLMNVVPLALLTVRGLKFYVFSDLLAAAILGSVALLAFTLGPQLSRVERSQKLMQFASVIPAGLSWSILAANLVDLLNLHSHWVIPFATLPFSGLLLMISLGSVGDGTGFRRAAAVVALLGVSTHLLVCPGLASSLICLSIGVACLIYGCLVQQKTIFFSGLACIVLGLGYHFKYAIRLYSISNWGSLAMAGVVIIILASLIERHYQTLLNKAAGLRRQMKGWDY
jgi:hypothetical protein